MKKRMLFVNDVAFGGGVEKLMLTLIKEWEIKYRISVVTNRKDKDFYNYYPKSVKYYKKFFEFKAKRPFGHLMLWLSKFCNWIQYLVFNHQDIVIAIKEGEPTKFVAKLTASRKYAWIHTDVESCHWSEGCYSSNREELECLKRFNAVFCVSERTLSSVKKVIGDPGNLAVMYNPIDVKKILAKSKEKIEYTKGNIVRFISVGRLEYLKGYDILIDACDMLNKGNYKFELWIIGDGIEKNNLAQKISKIGANNIVLLGQKENPFPYMLQSNWFISSSRAEGFSLVSQEALVLGLPLMLTNCAGTEELLGKNSEYGIIMKINKESIYESMKKVLENSDLENYYREQSNKRKCFIEYENRIKTIEAYIEK